MPLHVTFRKVKTRAAISKSSFLCAEGFSLVPRVPQHARRMQGMSECTERTHEASYATVDSTTPNLGGTSRARYSSFVYVRVGFNNSEIHEETMVEVRQDASASYIRQLVSTTPKFMRTWRDLLLKFGKMLLDRIFRPAVERAVPRSRLPTFRGCRICVWTPTAFLRNMRDRP